MYSQIVTQEDKHQPMYSKREAASITGESVRTWSRRIKSGEIMAYRLGRNVRISREDLERFIAERRGAKP